MWVLVSYDVSTITKEGRRRLRHVAKICEGYGVRVQLSVFECMVDSTTWAMLRGRLLDAYKDSEDSLRFYFLGEKPTGKIEHHGIKPSLNMEGPIIL